MGYDRDWSLGANSDTQSTGSANSDWCLDSSRSIRSTGSANWQKVRRSVQANAAMGSLLNDIRSREDEQLYDRDWSLGANSDIQSTGSENHPATGAGGTHK